jgi:putative transposase
MREDNLLCGGASFWSPTDSNHSRPIYPNLARELVLTGVNQLWIADLTYIRLLEEFVFLAAILDAFSRRVSGWALEGTLDNQLTLAALRMALERRTPPPGSVHHSDRGSQYASRDYIALSTTVNYKSSCLMAHRLSRPQSFISRRNPDSAG